MTDTPAGTPLKYCKTCGYFLRGMWRKMHADWGHDVRDTKTTLDDCGKCDWCDQYVLTGSLELIHLGGKDGLGRAVLAPRHAYHRCTQCRLKHYEIRRLVAREMTAT